MCQGKISIAVVLALVASLAGCSDWYLRGTQTNTMSVDSVYVSADSAIRLRGAVNTKLIHSGVRLATKQDAEVILELTGEVFDRRVLSVDPISGKVREVEVGLEVGFSVRAKDGKLLAPFQKMRWVQDYVFDESSLLGTYEQQSTIQGELSQDAAATILLRLETIEFAQPSS
jgi:outer membrane lipopolysaccharide assembly protein LptE/RlpB